MTRTTSSSLSPGTFPLMWLGAHLSFTRFIIDYLKDDLDKAPTGNLLRSWNWGWFIWETILAGSLALLSQTYPVHDWYAFPRQLLCLCAFWRINEVTYAFYSDGISKVRKQPASSDLLPHQRLPMLLRSYLGLIIQFSVIYFCLFPGEGFKDTLCDFRDALYFSATTLTAIGQEGQEVKNHWLRLAHVYEAASGILLLVFALSIYVGQQVTRKKRSALRGSRTR
jgi:voltage-gated potassium channel